MIMEKMSYREITEELNRVGGVREFMPNLKGWTDEEIIAMLPDQDERYAQGEEGLCNLLGDIEYREEDDRGTCED
jgi:hypothetical protein